MKPNEKPQMKNSIEDSKPQEWTCMKCGKKGEGYPYARVVGIGKGKGKEGDLCEECGTKGDEDGMSRHVYYQPYWTRGLYK